MFFLIKNFNEHNKNSMKVSNSYDSFYSNPYKTKNSINLMQYTSNPCYSKEQHKIELMQQIEENKHRKMFEMQQKIEMEKRECAKFLNF